MKVCGPTMWPAVGGNESWVAGVWYINKIKDMLVGLEKSYISFIAETKKR